MAQKKKLQVFVSSTYIDLKEERQAAVEAILTAGHIPAGMELFTAGDQSQMDVIKRWINESDVFLLILGGRYGSIEPKSQKSYIHLEYEYAIEQNKPYFAVVISDAHLDEKVKAQGSQVLETEHGQKLREFKNIVLSRMVKFWSSPLEIKLAIYQTLADLRDRNDVVGWVPGNEALIMAAATPVASEGGTSISARAASGVRRLQHDAESPHVADAVIEAGNEIISNKAILDENLEPIWRGRDFKLDERQCFVLMPFQESFHPIYADHIRQVAERLGLICARPDDIYNSAGFEDIWELICKSKIIISDLTGRDPTVFYETGIAHTVGKKVMLIAQSIEDIPYNFRRHRCIIYAYTPRGMKAFEQALERTLHALI
ncbi:MAG TPA: DUF4062 domain-containing protein [Anaerolineales bacterium]|jgi:uncharacterized protein DUF4062|nr:DUF4062 domain-containing protein [Anaerolineales bacterium]